MRILKLYAEHGAADCVPYLTPNNNALFVNIESWKLIADARPDIFFLHRSSNLVDYEMIRKNKKLWTKGYI
jgi:hypothetical protein